MPKPWFINRRTVLRHAGVTLALPFLDAMVERSTAFGQSASGPARAAFLYIPNGVNIMKWTPSGQGVNFALSPSLAPLARLQSEVSVLSGLLHPNAKGGHSGADTWLTGANLEATPGYDYKNTVSVDQIMAEAFSRQTRFPSLELSSSGGTGKPGHSHTLAFSRNGIPLPAERDPRRVFERLFVDEYGNDRNAKLDRFTEDRSILDVVLNQATDLRSKLGSDDQRKLDEYLTSVREVERRVQRNQQWMDIPKPRIDAKSLNLDAKPYDRRDRRSYFRVMFDLILLAFQTDTTRVVTFEMGREAAGGMYDELGVDGEHHELSHHGGDPAMLESLHKIDRFLVDQYAYFLDRLASTRDASGSLLHQTIVPYGSGMNSGKGGGHSPRNLPLLVAGGRRLGMRTGQHLMFQDDRTPLCNVFVTILNRMGIRTDRFQDSTGTLTGI